MAPIANGTLTPRQQQDLITSLAHFYISLSRIPYHQCGSLVRDVATGKLEIGPLISPDFCQTTPPFFFGPFESSAHRYLAQVEYVIQEIEQGRAFAEDTTFSVYVTHLWLKDLIQNAPRLWKKEETFIKHADDKGDQIMVDENGTLVGVIDWEWLVVFECLGSKLKIICSGHTLHQKARRLLRLSPWLISTLFTVVVMIYPLTKDIS